MENLVLNIKVLEGASDEIRLFEADNFDLEIYMPYWKKLIAEAKLEFMNKVYQELPHIIFTDKECDAIINHEAFLDLCWRTWIDQEKSIFETIQFAVECLLN